MGHLDLAFDYWSEAAFTDIRNLHDNVDDGVHIAAAASTWAVAVAGFGGMRDYAGHITFAPRQHPGYGFGYDPIFELPERGLTVGEIPRAEKEAISHRGRAGRQIQAVLAQALHEPGSG